MITWDEAKRLQNIAKHGVDFAIAQDFLSGVTVTFEDTRANYGESRYQTLGLYQGVVVRLVVHTPRQDVDHIISIRKADKHEQKYYWQNAIH
jgi:uncharacterized protein